MVRTLSSERYATSRRTRRRAVESTYGHQKGALASGRAWGPKSWFRANQSLSRFTLRSSEIEILNSGSIGVPKSSRTGCKEGLLNYIVGLSYFASSLSMTIELPRFRKLTSLLLSMQIRPLQISQNCERGHPYW